jgi:hypothetical protein
MSPHKSGKARHIWHVVAIVLAATLIASCGSPPPRSIKPVPTAPAHRQTPGLTLPELRPPVLHGATNFLLRTPLAFSRISGSSTDGNGKTTQLDARSIQSGINDEFAHLLFMVDETNTVRVYPPGTTTPTIAQVTQHTDGSAELTYTQTSNSEAGSFTLFFDGLLSRDSLSALYEQRFSPLLISSTAASDVTVTFTAPVRWVQSDEIPAAPAGGTYHLTDSGGIALSWESGQGAAAYAVYRLISARDQQFRPLTTVKSLAYTDSSPQAIQQAHARPGIAYAIFSLGPTGVENPGDLIISVSG